jgi:hypothetical protein
MAVNPKAEQQGKKWFEQAHGELIFELKEAKAAKEIREKLTAEIIRCVVTRASS